MVLGGVDRVDVDARHQKLLAQACLEAARREGVLHAEQVEELAVEGVNRGLGRSYFVEDVDRGPWTLVDVEHVLEAHLDYGLENATCHSTQEQISFWTPHAHHLPGLYGV